MKEYSDQNPTLSATSRFYYIPQHQIVTCHPYN
jgi:hypothetical protein